MALTPIDLAMMRLRQKSAGGNPYAAPGGAPVGNMASSQTVKPQPAMAPGIDPRTAFLMSAGGRLLQGMAPSTNPANQSFAGNLGGAVQAGMPAYQGALKNQMVRKQFDQQQTAAKLATEEKTATKATLAKLYPGLSPGLARLKYAEDIKTPKVPENVRQARLLREQFNLSNEEAVGIANGWIKVIPNPVTGENNLVNIMKGTSKRIAPKAQAAQAPQAPEARQPRTLFEIASGGESITGVWPAIKEGAEKIFGQIPGISFADPQFLQDRQTIQTEQNALIRALSINPRFPVGEINRLREEINLSPGMIDSTQALQARMQSVDLSLRRRLGSEDAAAKNTALPVKTRQAAAQAAKDIRNFLKVLGVPKGKAPAKNVPVVGIVEDGYRFIGGDPSKRSSWKRLP